MILAHLLVKSELLLIAVTTVRLLTLLPGDAGTWNETNKVINKMQL